MMQKIFVIIVLILISVREPSKANDWPRFRGDNGQGISSESVAVKWSEKKNMKWQCRLPGPGSSSPVISKGKIFVTCFSGVNEGQQDTSKLMRHVLCINQKDGSIIWENKITATQPEDPYRGFLTEHGYASNTPVVDDGRLFVYLGKSGIHAYDLNGKKLWSKSLGTGSTRRKWGSAASPIIVGDNLVVSAAEESLAVYGLDPKTGKQNWISEGDSLEMAYATPVLMKSKGGRADLVLPVPGEIWGMNPESGKLRWYASTNITGNISPSPVIGNETVYVFGGYPSLRRCAVKIGGARGEISEKATLWEDNQSTYVPTPVLVDERLYWASDTGYACCADAKSGKMLFRERLDARAKGSRGKPFYASAVAAGGKIYTVSRWGGTFVFSGKPDFELLAQNRIEGDDSQFHGTPAISDGQLFLRSDKFLYCISE
ncbi:MAG: PQQ-binding-like beta-propeller repeat protein [Verrucomicrobiota bacterium]|nr:PQQ-binding-like beta-propeller repeat protein [Verrucomicrobiota bacterium]